VVLSSVKRGGCNNPFSVGNSWVNLIAFGNLAGWQGLGLHVVALLWLYVLVCPKLATVADCTPLAHVKPGIKGVVLRFFCWHLSHYGLPCRGWCDGGLLSK